MLHHGGVCQPARRIEHPIPAMTAAGEKARVVISPTEENLPLKLVTYLTKQILVINLSNLG
jgi:hypothetical protein